MTSVKVRPAKTNDIPELCKLYFAFHEYHAAGVPDRLNGLGPWDEFDASHLASSLEDILKDPNSGLFVAETEGALVGFAEIYLREDEANPTRNSYIYGHLQSLIVTGGWRKQGIGRRLLHAAEIWRGKKAPPKCAWIPGNSPVIQVDSTSKQDTGR